MIKTTILNFTNLINRLLIAHVINNENLKLKKITNYSNHFKEICKAKYSLTSFSNFVLTIKMILPK